MRLLGLFLRLAGCIAVWAAIVLAFALLAALLPSLLWFVLPSSLEYADVGLISLVAGFIGLFIGLWPAILGVEWLVRINDRLARERSPRSGESKA